ncbi:hypothetical protein GJ744_000043 [Endocarpon pusillum]|uniref:Initiator tRNA phosphoribosyl transferase n=1 Tax=Endocarpon pusillum TaxID=364733 RepID=A0A8H7EAH3_9EURO|nr:hypothetical protein GJ744_000043 [Endocarpon pusillum]
MSSYPRSLADLKAGDEALLSMPKFYGSLKELRKSTLSTTNRLRSIVRDADFVQEVAAEYQLPLIANERCGSWYVPPETKAGSVYFKSTDGHTGQWSFSLRRLNLQVLDLIGQHGGCIIVDSTRRGKVMPDAFSKTVPIWCAVINRALFPEQQQYHQFQLPGIKLPASEVSQIESRLEDFVIAFQDLAIDVGDLRRRLGQPMRVEWVIGHSTRILPADERRVKQDHTLCHTVILCSASRRVDGAEMSEGGYIQGAGDDSEGWSSGITPQIFWMHKDMLLHAQEDKFPELIEKLLSGERQFPKPYHATLIAPTKNLYISSWTNAEDLPGFDVAINCNSSDLNLQDSAKQLNLECGPGKLGSRNLRRKLQYVDSRVASILLQNPASQILVTCKTGKDLSTGVALMLLCHFYSSDGKCIHESRDTGISTKSAVSSDSGQSQQRHMINKGFIRQRLAWITSSRPDANPSRSTLQSINAYLMDKPECLSNKVS